MVVQNPLKPCPGEIEIKGMLYKFKATKISGAWVTIKLFDYKTAKPENIQIKVPKNLTIGAPFNTGDFVCCLFKTEIKSCLWWSKWKFKK